MDAKWYRLARYDSAVVSMPDGTSAALYQRDPALYRDLLRRTVEIHERLRREWPRLAAEYRAALRRGHLAGGVGEDLRGLDGRGRRVRPGEQARAGVRGSDESGRRQNAAERARRLLENQADAMPVVEATDGPRADRVVDAELAPPAPRGGLLEVFQQPYLLRLIVSRQLAQMYAASLLGLAWSYVQPALRFAIYYFVMGFILRLHKDTPYFAIHLFTGMVVVHYFTETLTGGTRSIWAQQGAGPEDADAAGDVPGGLDGGGGVPHAPAGPGARAGLPARRAGTSTWTAVAAGVLGVLILMTFAMALALFFSAFNVFFRDFRNIVGTIMQFMHFLVPMMYPFTLVWDAHESPSLAVPDLRREPGRPGGAAAAAVLLVPADRGHRRPRTALPAGHVGARVHHPGACAGCCCGWPRGSSPGSRASSRSVSDDGLDRGGERHQAVHAAVPPHPQADGGGHRTPAAAQRQFLAVNDVSFTVEQGESVGLMGLNGSGKSTLLKLINGVMRPDAGRSAPAAGSPG